jgi:hypothetical protein
MSDEIGAIRVSGRELLLTATASLLQLALISSLHCISENTSFSTEINKVGVESRSTLCIVGSRTLVG